MSALRSLATASAVSMIMTVVLAAGTAVARSEMPRDGTCPSAPTEGMRMPGAMMDQGDCDAMTDQGMHGAMTGMDPDDHPEIMGMDPDDHPEEMGMPASPSPASPGHRVHHPSPAPEGSAGSGAATPADSMRIHVTLTDALRIETASMQVSAGVPVTFVVTNAGVLSHEFVVGDEAVQEAHETSMQGMVSMTHDEPTAIGLAPGETKELMITFSEPGETLAGCHIPGHYAAGMWAAITVTP